MLGGGFVPEGAVRTQCTSRGPADRRGLGLSHLELRGQEYTCSESMQG